MRIGIISDLHGNLVRVPDCDLLLIAGDICPFGGWTNQVAFLNTQFTDWLENIVSKDIPVVGIAGNHDIIFEKYSHLVPDLPWTYLQDTGARIKGLNIWGTPWTLAYGFWSFMNNEEFLAEKFSYIPDDVDVLISHGPPYGYGDGVYDYRAGEKWPTLKKCGSKSLLERIMSLNLKAVAYGHIHPGFGQYRYGDTILVNAAIVDDSIEVVHGATIVEI